MRASLSLLVALAAASAACTSTEIVAPRARTALGQSTSDDFVHLPTATGGTVDFGPNATLTTRRPSRWRSSRSPRSRRARRAAAAPKAATRPARRGRRRSPWIGLVPVEPVYRSEDGGWSTASGVELSGEL